MNLSHYYYRVDSDWLHILHKIFYRASHKHQYLCSSSTLRPCTYSANAGLNIIS